MLELIVRVTYQQIADLLVTAFEGGINYWCNNVVVKHKDGPVVKCQELIGMPDLVPDCVFTLRDAEDGTSHIFGIEQIKKGLELMAANHQSHFADIINDNHDAETADVFVQLSAFGELVFG